MKVISEFSHFNALDLRVGTIVKVEESKTKKTTWKMTIDFGKKIGIKTSCGDYTNYTPSQLIELQVICIINLEAKKMGPEISEVLVLGIKDRHGKTVPLTVETKVENGEAVF